VVELPGDLWDIDDMAAELAQLADSAGAEVLHIVRLRRARIDPAYFIGRGQAERVGQLARECGADVVIFNNDLHPAQERNLEKIIDVKIVDRTELILDIFAQHARTREGKLQVEMAQLSYLLPRLKGRGVLMSRLGGGIGTRGPGEMKLEIDRRRIRKRLQKLQRELEEVRKHRSIQRKARKEHNLPTLAIVGYTNAGKSTLLNALTEAGVLVEDKLFATLDPTSRKLVLPNNQELILTDTVGFIRGLPHSLVAAFRATLEEVTEADILLHIIDASHDRCVEQAEVVERVLEELGAEDKEVITVLNKVDKIYNPYQRERILHAFPDGVFVSAKYGIGLDALIKRIMQALAKFRQIARFRIPQSEGKVISLLHSHGKVKRVAYEGNEVILEAEVGQELLGKLARFRI